ncbi:MAG TPA: anti-sigma factor [Solirubrobacterales bacterium]|nr:anti-sigma factor [Solirubrobacterales bacterium]
MNEREHAGRRDELAPYLLGALEPGEVAALEQHLAGCEECRAELAWLRPAAQMLPEAVERVEAPAELRTRIMGEVEADVSRRSRRDRRGLFGGLQRWTDGRRLAAGLAAVLVVAAGVAGYAISGGGSEGNTITVAAGHAPGVTAKMVREGDSGTLRLANVHQLPSNEVLQAWVRRGKQIESAKTLFVPNRDGTATAVIDHMQGVNTVMVTAEPRGGSAHPTSAPIVAVGVPQ